MHGIYVHVYSLCVFYPGGVVVHSYGRLIPNELPVTDLQQISGLDGIGRITCTVSSGTARFSVIGALEIDDVTPTGNGSTATLVVNTTNVTSFNNRDVFCTDGGNVYFYLFLSPSSKCTTQCKHYSWGRDMTYSISIIHSSYLSITSGHIRSVQNKMCNRNG